ncbi:basic salivary proline-rich protein 1-like [Camarhynchus parvulus]|uniref:basic salivary proline-rich protein 1-like n=1 Tax=Geospiza parvula TaxID=87175 RepID=UPI001237E2DD|nr:basic salivary proline-rich protein 1-like [Camarhynchus parvulus]
MMELEPCDTDGLCDLKKREAVEPPGNKCRAADGARSIPLPRARRLRRRKRRAGGRAGQPRNRRAGERRKPSGRAISGSLMVSPPPALAWGRPAAGRARLHRGHREPRFCPQAAPRQGERGSNEGTGNPGSAPGPPLGGERGSGPGNPGSAPGPPLGGESGAPPRAQGTPALPSGRPSAGRAGLHRGHREPRLCPQAAPRQGERGFTEGTGNPGSALRPPLGRESGAPLSAQGTPALPAALRGLRGPAAPSAVLWRRPVGRGRAAGAAPERPAGAPRPRSEEP